MRWRVAWTVVASALACAHTQPSRPPDIGVGPQAVTVLVIGRTRRDSAGIADFVADVAATDSAGECSVKRGPKVTTASATFPALRGTRTMVLLDFDSAGTLVRYTERRDPANPRPLGVRGETADSIIRARAPERERVFIQFDYALDHAEAMNIGGPRPSYSIEGRVSQLDTLASLGVLPRLERVRQLCGL